MKAKAPRFKKRVKVQRFVVSQVKQPSGGEGMMIQSLVLKEEEAAAAKGPDNGLRLYSKESPNLPLSTSDTRINTFLWSDTTSQFD